jgi:hypothetical protein
VKAKLDPSKYRTGESAEAKGRQQSSAARTDGPANQMIGNETTSEVKVFAKPFMSILGNAFESAGRESSNHHKRIQEAMQSARV